MMRFRLWLRALGLSGLIALSGCTAQRLHRSGMEMMGEGNVEAGLDALSKAVQAAPRDAALRKDFYMAKTGAVNALLASAQQKQASGDYAAAEADLRKLQAIDPANPAATQGLQNLRRGGGGRGGPARGAAHPPPPPAPPPCLPPRGRRARGAAPAGPPPAAHWTRATARRRQRWCAPSWPMIRASAARSNCSASWSSRVSGSITSERG